MKLQSSSIQKWAEALLESLQLFSDFVVELAQLLLEATTTLNRLDKSLHAVGFFGITAEIPYSLPTAQTESKFINHTARTRLARNESLLPQRGDLFRFEAEGCEVGGSFIDFSSLAIFLGFLPRHN